jgi:tRNA(His) 5'-end guanylyltransferase
MQTTEFETLGDRLKAQERIEASRKADKTKPLMCRLDGRSFHTFTRGLKRPYDSRLSGLMIATMHYLVEETHASMGYTQSDEITLYWNLDLEKNPQAQFIFDGKFQKLTSVLAGMASGYFNKNLRTSIKEKSDEVAIFDARVWNVDNINDAYLNFLWRQEDAIKNSISMAAHELFSTRKLDGVNSETRKEMMLEAGYDWHDTPDYFKFGTFAKRVNKMVELSPLQMSQIPLEHRPDGPVERSTVESLNVGDIRGDAEFRKMFV